MQYNLLPIVAVIVLSFVAKRYIIIEEKSILNLLKMCGIIMAVTLLGYGSALMVNPLVRDYVLGLRNKLFNKLR